MNSLNSNNEPLFGTKNQVLKHSVLWFLVAALSIVTAKSCNEPNDQTPLFISKQK